MTERVSLADEAIESIVKRCSEGAGWTKVRGALHGIDVCDGVKLGRNRGREPTSAFRLTTDAKLCVSRPFVRTRATPVSAKSSRLISMRISEVPAPTS